MPAETEVEPIPGSSKSPLKAKKTVQKSKITNFFERKNESLYTNKHEETKKEEKVNNNEKLEELSTSNKRKSSFEFEELDKKIKKEENINADDNETDSKLVAKNVTEVKSRIRSERCHICKQFLDSQDLIIYNGHPNGAVEESVALIDPKLMLFTGEETKINDHDLMPHNKVSLHLLALVYDRASD